MDGMELDPPGRQVVEGVVGPVDPLKDVLVVQCAGLSGEPQLQWTLTDVLQDLIEAQALHRALFGSFTVEAGLSRLGHVPEDRAGVVVGHILLRHGLQVG
jgi:hypothetical protein